MNVLRVNAVSQAELMLGVLTRDQPGKVDRLRADALNELAASDEVQIELVPDTQTEDGCSVAGGYTYATTPPTLTVAQSASRRRQQFTVLHELGHHLQKNDPDLAAGVRAQPADIADFEDAACDAFAGRILIPDTVLAALPAGRSPTAADVVRIFDMTQASRPHARPRRRAVGSTASSRPRQHRHLIWYRQRRLYPPLAAAARRPHYCSHRTRPSCRAMKVDDTHFVYRNGSRSEQLYGDAAWSGDCLIVVAVRDLAGWKRFALPRNEPRRFVPQQAWCDVCMDEFTPNRDDTCTRCQQPRCPTGHCACTSAKERPCDRCFLLKHAAQFPSDRAMQIQDGRANATFSTSEVNEGQMPHDRRRRAMPWDTRTIT